MAAETRLTAQPHHAARAADAADFFDLFSLPAHFDIDAAQLRRRFLELSRRCHPDAVAMEDAAAQAAALATSARVNEAYETLCDPVRRAEYLLRRAGGKSAADDKRVPPELLSQTLMLREEIEQARAAGDQATLTAVRKGVLQQKSDIEDRIADLARRLVDRPDDALRDDLRLQLNAMKYVGNLLAQL